MSPEEIRNKTFSIVRKGYERGEVHRFLDTIANEIQSFSSSSSATDALIVGDAIEPAPVDTISISPPVEEPDDAELPDLGLLDVIDEPSSTIAASEPEPEPIPEPEPVSAFTEPAAAVPAASAGLTDYDGFDRVGNEISLMLRQAQESAVKIRTDAEVEARALVDQVRLDIEADRLAHERAASDLIARTEERASQMRTEAERYADDTRRSADDYSLEQRNAADRASAEAQASAEADRKLAADKLESATREADATIAAAREEATNIVDGAERQALETSDRMLAEARSTLTNFVGAEQATRDNLTEARSAIDAALSQLRLTDIDTDALTSPTTVAAEADVMTASSEDFLSTSLLENSDD